MANRRRIGHPPREAPSWPPTRSPPPPVRSSTDHRAGRFVAEWFERPW